MSVESTQRAENVRQETTASNRPLPAEACAGCRELAQRIERLERRLDGRAETIATPALSTIGCYWICIAVHAFVIAGILANESGHSFGLLVVAGSIATLAVGHVFSTCPIHFKLLRTFLSIMVVGAAAIVAMSLADVSSADELLAIIVAYFPIAFGSAWLVAKLFVWTRGWRVASPNGASEWPKLRIWHLLLYTFVVAVYLAMGRWLIDDIEELLGAEMAGLVIQIGLPTAFCTVFACFLAKIILLPRNRRVFWHVAILATSALAISTCLGTLLFLISGASSMNETFLTVAFYAPVTTLAMLGSPCFTFLMLRTARYRFVSPRAERDVAWGG